MQQKQSQTRNYYRLYNESTDPTLPIVSPSMPLGQFTQPSWFQRFLNALGNFLVAVVRKINQLLALALGVLILLLLGRFLLIFFGITTSLFTQWIYLITGVIVFPFDNLLPTIPYNGFSIDVTTIIATTVYTIFVLIVRQFLRVLVSRPQ